MEHRHQRVGPIGEQLGGARLVSGATGDDQHRAGLDIAAENTALENLSQEVADQIVTRLAVQIRTAQR
jgi:hypothetical protein